MIKKLLIFFFFATLSVFSQEKKILISGKVIDSIGVIKNVNIINLETNQGTSSNDNGVFRIFVKLGDSIQVSSIQHISKTIAINNYNVKSQLITIHLKSNIYQLDAFELKRHNLSGRLGIDAKNVPTNKKDSLLNALMDFSNVNMKIVEADDYTDKRVRPQKVETDPTKKFVGAGAAISMPFKYSERLWALRRKLAQQKAFPYKVLNELGEKFFFDQLKIPVDKYFHFLEYCNPLGIENLHKENKLLELIKILREESIEYLKIIKKE